MPTNTAIVPVGLPDAEILAGQLAPSSIARYRGDAALYGAWCAAQGLDAFQPPSLARYRQHLAQGTTLAPSTINRRMAAIRRIAREAAEQGYIAAELAARFGQVRSVPAKALKGRGRAHNRTKIEPSSMRILCNCPNDSTPAGLRDRALLALLASSGVRIAEACGVRVGDLVSRDGGVFVRVVGKNKVEPRDAPLSAEAFERIRVWLRARSPELCPNSPYVFVSQAGRGGRWTERPLSPAGAWAIVKKYALACEMPHVTPHAFRRFCITEIVRITGDIRKGQRAAGHSDISTTAKFYVLDELTPGLTESLY